MRAIPLLAAALTFTLSIRVSTGAADATAAEQSARPNIVVILADDMGYSDIGCYGSEISTPNIDRLATDGLRFTQFYNTARCCPTRASLLTGLYPHQAEMGWMAGRPTSTPGYRNELSKNAVTIAEALKPAGYASYMAGKWHVTSKLKPDSPQDNWPRQRGFDRFYGTVQGGGSYYDPAMLTRDNTPITPEGDGEYEPRRYYYTDAITDHSVRFITEHPSRAPASPFFLYVAYTAPHWPLHAPEETIAKYKGKYDGGYEPVRAARFERMKSLGLVDPRWQLSAAPWKWEEREHKVWEARCMEVYAAQVERMDEGIGRIVAALQETGKLDDTLIVFLADNGGCAEKMGRDVHEDRRVAPATQPRKSSEIQTNVFPRYTPDGRPVRDGHIAMPGSDESYVAYGQGWANVSNTPFREYKHWVHEGGISTPLVAHWPAGIPRRGELDPQPGHLIDLMATFIDVSGATYPAEFAGNAVQLMQGVSLAPAFRGASLERPTPIFFEHEGNRAVRDGKWKLVAKGPKGSWELYDMEADRTEMNDRAAQEPTRVRTMGAQWQSWAETSNVLPLMAWQARDKPPARRAAE
ncbi:MAG: arylsulfatase [Tepidisphaeraceae bacterium]